MTYLKQPRHRYPFPAIVGQDTMKLALILNVINPAVGGVLIRGEKGTAKSTAVRALANILPEIEVSADCPYSCDPQDTTVPCPVCQDRGNGPVRKRKVPVVELPLSATEDMVVGGLDFSASAKRGVRVFQPGLLGRANRGILYVDEVNLLSDHLVNAILDVSASGENVVQREGIAFRHPARFILVGTMNPEEGELRPQLLDRFGLYVESRGELDMESRVEVMERRDAFDRDAPAFCKGYEQEVGSLVKKISQARGLLPHVSFQRKVERLIADICVQHAVAGHRADIVMANTARTLAAFSGRYEATEEDALHAASLTLPHRTRLQASQEDASPDARPRFRAGKPNPEPNISEEYPEQEPVRSAARHWTIEPIDSESAREVMQRSDQPEAIFGIGSSFRVKEISHQPDKVLRQASGKRSRTRTRHKKGKYLKSTPHRQTGDIAFDATIRAAAPFQSRRKPEGNLVIAIRDEDIREKIRESRTGTFLLFIVDASGSMGAKGRMVASKGAIMSLLQDAYQKRDRVAMVSFRKQEALVNLPPTSSIYRAGELLRDLPVGGKTPLAAGLRKGQGVLRNVLIKDPTCKPILIIITDGKANESIGKGDPFWEALAAATELASDLRIKSIVVDAEEEGGFRYELAARLATVLKADYFKIKDLQADVLLDIVRSGG